MTFPNNGHGPCSDCQVEKFDPWDIIAVPMWWGIVTAYWVRDCAQDFIRRCRSPK